MVWLSITATKAARFRDNVTTNLPILRQKVRFVGIEDFSPGKRRGLFIVEELDDIFLLTSREGSS